MEKVISEEEIQKFLEKLQKVAAENGLVLHGEYYENPAIGNYGLAKFILEKGGICPCEPLRGPCPCEQGLKEAKENGNCRCHVFFKKKDTQNPIQ
ncbi:MAG: hypothetical protein QMD50_00860 [Patescibacteria group bacterium]|nr:hypothetical protein [Patescibacteria group bacterium]